MCSEDCPWWCCHCQCQFSFWPWSFTYHWLRGIVLQCLATTDFVSFLCGLDSDIWTFCKYDGCGFWLCKSLFTCMPVVLQCVFFFDSLSLCSCSFFVLSLVLLWETLLCWPMYIIYMYTSLDNCNTVVKIILWSRLYVQQACKYWLCLNSPFSDPCGHITPPSPPCNHCLLSISVPGWCPCWMTMTLRPGNESPNELTVQKPHYI